MGVTLLLIFISVSLAVACGFQIATGWWSTDARRVQRRLLDEFRSEASAAPNSPLFKNLDQMQIAPASFDLDQPTAVMSEAPLVSRRARLEALLEHANLKLTVNQLFMLMGGLGFVLGMTGTYLRGAVLGLPMAAVGVAVPLLFVAWKRHARRERFVKQLPNAFDLMARVLRSGHSVSQALQAVAESFDDPMAAEFATCQHQLNLGLGPDVAFQQMAERCGVVEMRIFVMAMLIQRQTGGNLSEVLERLAHLVRARLRLRSQVRTLTAEGRMQGLTLAALPFVLFVVMMILNHDYASILLQHGYLLAGTVVMIIVGMLWIRKIVSIEI